VKTIRVFISSKQLEFVIERALLAQSIRAYPLMEPVLAGEWPPQRASIRDHMLEEARTSPIYLGLFGAVYSEPTEMEYRAAAENSYRELLIYIKDSARNERDQRLSQLIAEMKDRHVTYSFGDVRDLMPMVPLHLSDAIARMVDYLQKLGEAPTTTRSAQSVLQRRHNTEVEALKSLGFRSWSPQDIDHACSALSVVPSGSSHSKEER
jgi:hypothetical protein